MLALLMGLLGHVSLKIQFLNILQRMTERSAGPSADGEHRPFHAVASYSLYITRFCPCKRGCGH